MSTPDTSPSIALRSLHPAVSVAAIGNGVVALREESGRGQSLRYTQLLHGCLTFHPAEGALSVTAFVNDFAVAGTAARTWASGNGAEDG